ncbi:ABC transporter permease, partial [Staphylococcus aureus]
MKGLMKATRLRELPVAGALVLLIVVTTLINPRFLTPQSVKDLLLNATILMILAAGQALVLITRNVDLSVGSI